MLSCLGDGARRRERGVLADRGHLVPRPAAGAADAGRAAAASERNANAAACRRAVRRRRGAEVFQRASSRSRRCRWSFSPVRAGACAYVAGGALAVAVLAGPWLALMMREFGNPVFPLMNAWFQSPDAPPVNLVSGASRRRTSSRRSLFPFRMVVLDRSLYSEIFAPDLRFAALARLRCRRRAAGASGASVADWRLLGFFALALRCCGSRPRRTRATAWCCSCSPGVVPRAPRRAPAAAARRAHRARRAARAAARAPRSSRRRRAGSSPSRGRRTGFPTTCPSARCASRRCTSRVETLPMAVVAPFRPSRIRRSSTCAASTRLPPDSPRLAALLERHRGRVRVLGRALDAQPAAANATTLRRIGYRLDPADCFTIEWRRDDGRCALARRELDQPHAAVERAAVGGELRAAPRAARPGARRSRAAGVGALRPHREGLPAPVPRPDRGHRAVRQRLVAALRRPRRAPRDHRRRRWSCTATGPARSSISRMPMNERDYHDQHYEAEAALFETPLFRRVHERAARQFLRCTAHADRRHRVLSLGCGDGSIERRLAPHVGEIVGVDISPVAIDQARARSAQFAEPRLLRFPTATRSLPRLRHRRGVRLPASPRRRGDRRDARRGAPGAAAGRAASTRAIRAGGAWSACSAAWCGRPTSATTAPTSASSMPGRSRDWPRAAGFPDVEIGLHRLLPRPARLARARHATPGSAPCSSCSTARAAASRCCAATHPPSPCAPARHLHRHADRLSVADGVDLLRHRGGREPSSSRTGRCRCSCRRGGAGRASVVRIASS